MSKRLLSIFILILFLLLLSACNSSTSGGESQEEPQDNTSVEEVKEGEEKAVEEMTSVKLVIGTADINQGYPWATLPLAMGWFEEEGLDVTLIPGESSGAAVQILLAGQADIGAFSSNTAMLATVNEDAPLKSVYPIARRNGNVFAVLDDSPIQDISDLKGTKVGFPDLGTSQVPFAHARFQESDVPIDSVEEIGVGYGVQAFEALNNGTVDSYVTFSSLYALGNANGYDIRALPRADWQNDMFDYSLYVTEDNLDSDIIAKVGRAFAKATVFLATNPEAAVKIFWEQYPERAPIDPNDEAAFNSDFEILTGQVGDMRADELPIDFPWGSQDMETWEFMQDFLYETGMIDEKLDPSIYFDNSNEAEFLDFEVAEIVKLAEDWE
ncbi:ABC transporter substrate-binding protein [Halalkalibacter okhensis]|uniref:SsuA/THI5-like domain-containing protein n=1 Tax=Halalkalibacter okhensis TaxID=333138 RepID=A0A0B0IAU1_9BACI|nr:ABC transporter substrate-binding protein [Halalkalibacter okhensis]KHF37972.1 hypothetical protein LQ50_24195 [Halalkalibacter okhensis]